VKTLIGLALITVAASLISWLLALGILIGFGFGAARLAQTLYGMKSI